MGASDTIEMIMAGLLSPSKRISMAVCEAFARLPSSISDDAKKVAVLDFLLNQLSDKMFKQSAGTGKNCHMYLTLMNKLVQVKAELHGGQSTIFMKDSEVV